MTSFTDEPALDDIVTRLVRTIDPDRIVLFGSRARGEATVDSDFDLLIVKPSDEAPHRRIVAAYRAVSGLGVPTDMLWRTPEEIADWADVPHYVTTRAIREGRVLYERPS